MKLSVSIAGMCGLTWSSWKRWVDEIERLGFAGLFRSDHFTVDEPPDMDSLELIVSLTYLASQRQSIHFGSMVSPLSFRDPIMLARQAMALSDLSGGRMILGVGAGWMEREHKMFGYSLGDMKTRMARFEEGLEVITRLIRSDAPVTFEGRFYHLHEAHLLPRPQHPVAILVGGKGPKRMLPLVARYADIWNCTHVSPEAFQERSSLLDDLIRKAGRHISEVKRTVFLPVMCWKDTDDLEDMVSAYRRTFPSLFGSASTDEIIGYFRGAGVCGTPEEVVEKLRAYEVAGVEELIIQVMLVDRIEYLEIIAEHVLPSFRV